MNAFAWLRRKVRDCVIGGVADALAELLCADGAPEEIEAVIEGRTTPRPERNGRQVAARTRD